MSFGFGGSSQPTFGSSSFGATTSNQQQPSTFGSFGAPASNQQQPSTFGSFGAPQSSNVGFGNQTNTFGAAQPAPSFGAAQPTSSFGTAQPAPSFGAAPSAGGSMFGSNQQPQQQQYGQQNQSPSFMPVQNPNSDYEIPRNQDAATDSISCLAWSPTSSLLCSGSWDNKVRCYDIQQQGMGVNAQFKAYIEHQGPVLDVCFKSDGSGCFSAGVTGVVKQWQFESNPGRQNATDVAKHDGPIKSVKWIPESNLLATAGWDKLLRYWDLRTPTNPVLQVQLPGRCDAMDIRHPYVVVALGGEEAERQVLIYNLSNPSTPETVLNQPVVPSANAQMQALQKPLRKQFRAVSIFPDKTGFAIASIEGRCAIRYFGQNRTADNFAFKCHRDKNTKHIYSINSLAFHPGFGTFATAGSDGAWCYWDKDSKQRLKQGEPVKTSNNEPVAITCASFNSNGTLYAYGLSYDWAKGAAGNPNGCVATIMIHTVREDEVRPKGNKAVTTTSTRRW